LSGGERNRIFLARLFTKPSNFLVMDEPTNDLDIETQELLEELLMEYSGTLILVSHDRVFLNNVVTSTIVVEGEGEIYEYPGGYDDWLRQRQPVAVVGKPKGKKKLIVKENKSTPPRKRSFKEKRELESLVVKIEKLEAMQDELYALLADGDFYKKEATKIVQTKAKLEEVEDELLVVFERWEQLEELGA
ncbi:MAG: ABC transporter ATP-binding protein, partial [Candidatus Aceula meridiana]|nr:ABC transporter ATP-binding protein [Candidatus Aceula meridiana]